MFVVILNWKDGENDPFTSFNHVLASYLDASGKRSKTLELSDGNWINQIVDLKCDGIDFVFTWQGLGTGVTVGEKEQSFWDVLQVPLIAYHGDHPCHKPANHALESRHCAHLYATREFSLYANRHFRKQSRAITLDFPVFSLDEPLGPGHGDHFVLIKNVTPPSEIENQWKQMLNGPSFDLYMTTAETLKTMLGQEHRVEIHPVMDDVLAHFKGENLAPLTGMDAYHLFHSQLDFYVRNSTSVAILDELKDIPLHVYGRGWNAFAASGNPHHQFHGPRDMAFSQSLYYSRYGIVDVTPSMTGIHDRTARAMRNETPFVSSAYLPGFLPDMDRYGSLFYEFRSGDLRAKCEAVMADPEAHAGLARDFSHRYQSRVSPSEFVWKLDSIARSLDRR